mmetsp:Transcript_4051/g.5105  ORF Transcript_4051/g.5105 Transcript_4051/m.5105 type:complete len:145 (-) Transcript_4051:532-966(-)|eukprot:CAMPEP_0204861924 /NCGR_PEP_ID=MMETSP1348-20121228/2042_1 /ASSEMBLY_ACC=CAM_ASM_000700 /TAXON_ID=215587 /ORGANISM="Aplanochytrium stocchinoi, Strain GSBS06" /LENGTH=144 /DNA_ID=CAMNT_0052011595 /DNA_START=599 /DNA_END=1033 /DNA_ORIENTATION=+
MDINRAGTSSHTHYPSDASTGIRTGLNLLSTDSRVSDSNRKSGELGSENTNNTISVHCQVSKKRRQSVFDLLDAPQCQQEDEDRRLTENEEVQMLVDILFSIGRTTQSLREEIEKLEQRESNQPLIGMDLKPLREKDVEDDEKH